MNRKGIGSLMSVALIVIIIVAGLAGYWFYKQLTTVVPPTPSVPYYGPVTISWATLSVFDQSAVSTSNQVFSAFNIKGKSFDAITATECTGGVSIANSGTDFTILPEDKGYIMMRIYGGDHYIDLDALYTWASPRVKDHKYLDVNADGYLDVIILLYFGDIAKPETALKPSYKFSWPCIPNDISSLAINTPADKATGTGTQTWVIEWQITTMTEKKGFKVARIYAVQNRTEEDKCKVKSVSVSWPSGTATYTGSEIVYDSGAKKWTVNIDKSRPTLEGGTRDYREVVYGVLVKRVKGGTSYLAITFSGETYFASSDPNDVTITVYVDLIGPDGTVTTKSDAVILKDA